MRVLKTKNSKLIRKLDKLKIPFVKSVISGSTFHCFFIDETDIVFDEESLGKYSKKEYFIENKLSF